MESNNFEHSITSASEYAITLDCNGLVYRFYTIPFPSFDNDLFLDTHHIEWVCHLIEYHPEDSSLS